jgi:hypothetical protein
MDVTALSGFLFWLVVTQLRGSHQEESASKDMKSGAADGRRRLFV